MKNLYSVNVDIAATAYIRADSADAAVALARKHLPMAALDLRPGMYGEVEISGKRFNDPELPQLSLSPAMTVQGARGVVSLADDDENEGDATDIAEVEPSNALAVPPMPPTAGRDSHGVGDYLESDIDWATSNPEAVTWLIDNHEAIRAALAVSAVPVATIDVADAFKALLVAGLDQSKVLSTMHDHFDQYPAYADAVAADDELEVDAKPIFSKSDNGCWVSAWVWVSDEAAGVEPDKEDEEVAAAVVEAMDATKN